MIFSKVALGTVKRLRITGIDDQWACMVNIMFLMISDSDNQWRISCFFRGTPKCSKSKQGRQANNNYLHFSSNWAEKWLAVDGYLEDHNSMALYWKTQYISHHIIIYVLLWLAFIKPILSSTTLHPILLADWGPTGVFAWSLPLFPTTPNWDAEKWADLLPAVGILRQLFTESSHQHRHNGDSIVGFMCGKGTQTTHESPWNNQELQHHKAF